MRILAVLTFVATFLASAGVAETGSERRLLYEEWQEYVGPYNAVGYETTICPDFDTGNINPLIEVATGGLYDGPDPMTIPNPGQGGGCFEIPEGLNWTDLEIEIRDVAIDQPVDILITGRSPLSALGHAWVCSDDASLPAGQFANATSIRIWIYDATMIAAMNEVPGIWNDGYDWGACGQGSTRIQGEVGLRLWG